MDAAAQCELADPGAAGADRDAAVLRQAIEARLPKDLNASLRLAQAARSVGGFGVGADDRRYTHGHCLLGVFKALAAALGKPRSVFQFSTDAKRGSRDANAAPQRSAATMLAWAAANPRSLCSEFGLARTHALAEGAVVFYAPGQCGFSRLYGHVEVIVADSVGCSDHCRAINRRCTPDLILSAVSRCELASPNVTAL